MLRIADARSSSMWDRLRKECSRTGSGKAHNLLSSAALLSAGATDMRSNPGDTPVRKAVSRHGGTVFANRGRGGRRWLPAAGSGVATAQPRRPRRDAAWADQPLGVVG